MTTISGGQSIPAEIQEILLTAEQLQERVNQLGAEISRDYYELNPLLVGVLKGVLFFMTDLLRAITVPVEVDFMAISSYSAESRNRGMVRLVKDLEIPLTGRHVLFVEDVVDTGLTLNYLLNTLRTRDPASLEVCALFNRSKHRLIDIKLRYVGFDLPDKFVVGYGLDYRERYRNLPYIGLLRPQLIASQVSK